MSNFKITLVILISSICIELSGAQAPLKAVQPTPNLERLKDFPGDLKRYIIPLIISGNPEQVAQGIYTTAAINKHFNEMMNNSERIIAILDSLPYTANGIDVVERLQNKIKTLPVMHSPQIENWLKVAHNKLVLGYELFKASGKDNSQMVARLLEEKNINLNWKEWGPVGGTTSLMRAIRKGRKENVALLLNAGVNVNKKADNGYTALIWASLGTDTEIVRRLLAEGAEVDTKTSGGFSALMNAVYGGRAEVAKLLLDAGANTQLRNMYGKSAIIYARERSRTDIIKLLEEAIAKQKVKRLEKQ